MGIRWAFSVRRSTAIIRDAPRVPSVGLVGLEFFKHRKDFADGHAGYFDVFPEKRTTELRTATFANGNADDPLPDGTFIFTEYFCTDLRCNCQRVLVKVFHTRSEDAPAAEVATISYSWNPSTDETWERLNSDITRSWIRFIGKPPMRPNCSISGTQ